MTPRRPLPLLLVAAGLALGAATSLGLARFSYALLLPPMRSDLGWSYLTAGAMNTANAAGYLVGALVMPRWLERRGARSALLGGGYATALLLAAHGFSTGDAPLYLLRAATGVASAATFVAGGLLAARLASGAANGGRSQGLVLGLYYGGTGIGIVVSALLVPPLAGRASAHAWQAAWIGLGVAALIATLVSGAASRDLETAPARPAPARAFAWRPFGYALASYFLFGLGYIGYMTFIVSLLREQRLGDAAISAFYVLLGLAVIASSWLWARLLQRFRGGESMAILNALLGLATLLPVISASALAVFVSGALFGAVFLSVVASTTALVRHNLPASAWPGGIGGFTIAFAAGQIVGPSLVGAIADRAGGLAGGLGCSAAVLACAALLAAAQRPLDAARAAA